MSNSRISKSAPLRAIKQFCYECSGETIAEVKRCTATACALYPYRLGYDPERKREMTEEQKAAATERLLKARGIDGIHRD